jgi:putative transposase
LSPSSAYALKSVRQSFCPSDDLIRAMESFRRITNECIRIGIETNVSSMKELSSRFYLKLREDFTFDNLPSRYYLTAISKAAGILSARKKSMKRGIPTKDPYLRKLILISCYSFKVTKYGFLQFYIAPKKKVSIQLNKHTLECIFNAKVQNEVRSFTISGESLSLSIRKKIEEAYIPSRFVGIDRNASNVTYGDSTEAFQFDLKKVEEIARTTRQIIRSFKRNDFRIRSELYSKYGRRRTNRAKQVLHRVSKEIVKDSKQSKAALVFENITGLRNLYRKGNFQGRNFRARMNSVPWYEIKRQIEYKAAWDSIPVLQLTKDETRGTSKVCPACGERLQEDRYSKVHKRELWCSKCGKWCDRDIIAVTNISRRGWLRFRQSKGEAGEAMVQEPTGRTMAILKVDASKFSNNRKTLTRQLDATDED